MIHSETSFSCRNCGLENLISPEKLRLLVEKGYDQPPLFCDVCIATRLDEIWETPGEKRLAICSDCGCETKLNFVPCQERAIYCLNCFNKRSC